MVHRTRQAATLSAQVAPERLRQVDRRTLLALRWYERAQTIESVDDAYLALWIALEVLAGGPGTDFLKRVWDLVVAAIGGPSQADAVRQHMDVRALRHLRNRVILGAGRELAPSNVEFAVSTATLKVVDGLIEDTLRQRLSLRPVHSLAGVIEARTG